jgi:glyoxylase-like metal-dependent hydrolase (beta-lactamase superfamily II)
MMVNTAKRPAINVLVTLILVAGCDRADEALSVDNYSCDSVPRPENAKLPLSKLSDDWFQVYEAADGVYSIVEPFQLQETISHLIVGEDHALLFDTGVGLLSIKAVVERITSLPVIVLNSHTHYDHVGGNWEFSTVLAIDSDYTRTNMRGFENSRISGDFLPEAFCKGAPEGTDPASFFTKSWKQSRYVRDGEVLDLGGRKLEVLHVPGHTPDAVALLDAENRLLFSGDSWYDASLWLFARETNLKDYEVSISRLAALDNEVDFLLGAHNSARVDAGRLQAVVDAFRKIRAGGYAGEEDSYDRLAFEINGVRILTTQLALDGKQGDISKGGSGLDTWPN